MKGLLSQSNPVKRRLRAEMIERRRGLADAARAEASSAIARRLLHWIDRASRPIESVALYSSIGAEVATPDLIAALLARRIRVALPYILHRARWLELRAIDRYPEGLRRCDFGILEPTPLLHPEVLAPDALDLIVLPGVAFDRYGYRLGYGGGYYDRVLQDAGHAPTLGLAFADQIVETIPTDPWDRRVDAVLTEREWIAIDWPPRR
jgi:5-formyltetrahydrofolate cyclo-ligase